MFMLIVLFSGFFAIRDERESINQEDLNKAVRKVAEAKKLEGKLINCLITQRYLSANSLYLRQT